MCEIILLFVMGKKIATMAAEKGRAGWPWVIMLVLFWFGGEITGAIIGVLITEGAGGGGGGAGGPGDDGMIVVMGCALGLAIAGAVLSFVIVSALPAIARDDDEYYDRPHRRRSRRDEDDYYEGRRERSRDEDDYDDDRRRRGRDEDDYDDRPRRRND